jgi:hypothetical protein
MDKNAALDLPGLRVVKEMRGLAGKSLVVQEDASGVRLSILGSRGGFLASVWLPREETAELGRALVRLCGE